MVRFGTRVLLCCEAGAGRGHVTALATVARALWPECRSQAVLPRLAHSEDLAGVCDRVDRGPVLSRRPDAPPLSRVNWADWLDRYGFADAAGLGARFDWWCEALRRIRPALVVADFAPTVLMAARALGVPAVATGAPFYSPPMHLDRYPDILSADEARPHGLEPADTPPPDQHALRAAINAALVPRGLPPLARLPEVGAAALAVTRGLSLYDPYAALRRDPLVLPLEQLPPLQARRGRELFVYFSTSELEEPSIVEALRRLPVPVCLVAGRMTPEQAAALSVNPRLRIAPAPLPHDRIVARARAILCSGQAGTLALAILAGIPVLALPVDLEKFANATLAARALPGLRVLARRQRSAEAILAAVAELWSQPEPAAAARADALRLRAGAGEPAREAYRRLLRPLLA